MTSKLSFKVMKTQSTVAYKMWLMPVKWDDAKSRFRVKLLPASLQKWKCSCYMWFFIFSVTVLQFIHTVASGEKSPLFLLLNTGFASAHLSGLVAFQSQTNAYEICQLFDCIKSFSIAGKQPDRRKLMNRISADTVMAVTIAFLTVGIIPVLPLVTFLLPCHQVSSSLFMKISEASCSNIGVQCLSYMVELVLLEVPTICQGFQALLLTAGLQTLMSHLSSIRGHAESRGVNGQKRRHDILLHYRKCQVFTNVINSVCQMCVLPQSQIAGAGIIIAGLYTAVVSQGDLHRLLYVGSIAFTFEVIIIVCGLLDITSRGLIASKGFIRLVRKWPMCRNGVFRRYVRSLQPLKIYSGPFHVIDKGRAPALLRFCLQRTTFLVVKSRTR